MLFVKAGDKVQKGDRLSEGNLDIHELFEHKGSAETGRYIVNEVQRIYLSEGVAPNNKHVEMIVKQMFSRVKIMDGGDADDFVMGEIVEKSKFLGVKRSSKRRARAGKGGGSATCLDTLQQQMRQQATPAR